MSPRMYASILEQYFNSDIYNISARNASHAAQAGNSNNKEVWCLAPKSGHVRTSTIQQHLMPWGDLTYHKPAILEPATSSQLVKSEA